MGVPFDRRLCEAARALAGGGVSRYPHTQEALRGAENASINTLGSTVREAGGKTEMPGTKRRDTNSVEYDAVRVAEAAGSRHQVVTRTFSRRYA